MYVTFKNRASTCTWRESILKTITIIKHNESQPQISLPLSFSGEHQYLELVRNQMSMIVLSKTHDAQLLIYSDHSSQM